MSKLYNHVYIRSEGDLTIKIILDGVTEVTKVLDTNLDTHDVSIPQESQRGFLLQFNIVGTGKVYEIEYKATGRTNGR